MIAQPTMSQNQNSSLTVNPADLEHHVRKLAIDFFPRSPYQTEKLNLSADYILAHFRKTKARVEEQHFSVSTTTDSKAKFRNLSAHFGPKNGPRIVIGAHYVKRNP